MFAGVAAALGSIATSWAAKLLTRSMIEWAILKAAETYVKSTKSKADDEWFKKIKKVVTSGK
jgi:hypothetical protein